MTYQWRTCPSDVKHFVAHLQRGISEILYNEYVGFYLHGSLAMGGFNPLSSDIDVLVVTKTSLVVAIKRELAKFFLVCSHSPFPVEISFLNEEQLNNWQHPCPFDFHFSEFWRASYEKDLANGTYHVLNDARKTDADLAAHITVTRHRGIGLKGKPIDQVFPVIPRADYVASIVNDYQECLERIEEDPIYCSLNLIRVFWYLKEGVIASKQEAGNWGLLTFPEEMQRTVKKVVACYTKEREAYSFEKDELMALKNYISNHIQSLNE
ncbi:streptomycin 3''-adenylyltransferase [Pullulanibacillus camelliae]|uniref:Spectinomycin 9-adenylyltransferase n=1 Tax=Pullulanibacillus camelliae TaxID=1707096 RepID=A0A8J2VP39_9BACL|nr:aminoglycoside adenylyltransferase domain-containing protein [Pullulanibacillus camelliae]GGE35159.1 streptomycin 3''-adenylyltransferase [Pullulanibacillus camelliae]